MSAKGPLGAENVNHLWARLLLEEWRRLGLRHVVVCPGSRSTPLALAAARTGGLTVTVVIDERSAGFLALGIAKASGVPAAVITTSGTAVANLLPAAVEATMSGTPLLLATADRPPELHDCGANQSIPQADLFGRFARWSTTLGCPTSHVDPAFVLSTADEAWHRATGREAGVVHCDCPFREPLAPSPGPLPECSRRLQRWAEGDRPWRGTRATRDPGWIDEPLDASIDLPEGSIRGLVACGADDDGNGAGRVAEELAELLGWPLLADIGAQRRSRRGLPQVAHSDVILSALAGTQLGETLQPNVVVRLGGPISSKRINEVVRGAATQILVRHRGKRFDEGHSAAIELEAIVPPDDHVHRLLAEARERPDAAFTARWHRASSVATRVLDAAMADRGGLDEPWIARSLAARLDIRQRLVLGNSMPIRDADAFVAPGGAPATVTVNRGASGIDGLVSTAVGCAVGANQSTVVHLGDLSLLHDLGGLAALRAAPRPVHVVVVNNDGGGIFHFLPIAQGPLASPEFERLFGTPHGLGFEAAARLFGLDYRRATTREEAATAFASLASDEGPTLVECVTDRRTNVDVHRSLQRAVAEALGKEWR